MPGIEGALVSDPKELAKIVLKKKKDYIEESVDHRDVTSYQQRGWEVVRKNKTTTRVRKKKALDVAFEDKVWAAFQGLGFSEMNKDRNCKLVYEVYTKQIDILARDKDNVFVVDCQSSEEREPINARQKLVDFVGHYDDIKKALEAEWGRGFGRINLLIVVDSAEKRGEDEEYVKAKNREGKNLLLWSSTDLEYIEKLVEQTGTTAKNQLYSVIFSGKRQKKLAKNYPALRGAMGGHTFYSFLISASNLLNYAYVHHRELTEIVEASQAYQRMLRSGKLNKIRKYIDDEEGCFPNTIIVNFSEQLQWRKLETTEDVQVGFVTLPQYYGCAWIIDGQHRLYGAALANREILLPILAFENMEEIEQAELFVDINKKQTSVPANLLWDLYSDIYRDSADEKQKKRYQIAQTAKNMETAGPLKGCIDIPSIPAERPIKLSLTTVCSAIENYLPWRKFAHPSDETRTPENAARLINSYFEVLKSLWPEDWERGNNGVLLSNSGFGVFIMIFRDIVRHIDYQDQKDILRPGKPNELKKLLKEKYLEWAIECLKEDAELQKAIKSNTGRGPESKNAAKLEKKIKDFVPDFSPPRLQEDVAQQLISKEKPPIATIVGKVGPTERILREFVLEKLADYYGSEKKWWKQGVPGELKSKMDEKWQSEVKRNPRLRKESEQNKRKFEYLTMWEVGDVVVYSENWEGVFINDFEDKNQVRRRIRDILVLRNPVKHERTLEDQDIADGIGGLVWLSNCLGRRDLNPYF